MDRSRSVAGTGLNGKSRGWPPQNCEEMTIAITASIARRVAYDLTKARIIFREK
jgi:hypothetical protein